MDRIETWNLSLPKNIDLKKQTFLHAIGRVIFPPSPQTCATEQK
jgi:hypothetical protein